MADRAKLEAGLYLIKMADDSIQTKLLEEAIADLQATIHARQNVPF